MFWNISTLITILSAALYSILFTVVVVSKPLTVLRRIFLFYLAAMLLWSVSAFLTITGLVDVLTWFKVMSISPALMMLAIFFFVQSMFGLRRKWAPYAVTYGLLVIIITLFTNIMVHSASLDQAGALHYELGAFFIFLAAPGFGLVLYCINDLRLGYLHTRDASQRDRIRYLILALTITVFASLINFTEFGKYPIDIAANGVSALLIAYAILRHHLLDIRVVVRLGLLYSITTAFFSAIYFLVISLVLNAFHLLSNTTVFIASIVVGALSAFLLSPLRDLAQRWIDRIFYRDKYHAERMLERLSETTASLLDIEKITDLILTEIQSTLHIEHGAILVKNEARGNFQVSSPEGKRQFFIGGLRADHPIVIWLSRHDQPLHDRDLALEPLFKSMWREENEELEKFNAEIFLPLRSKGELIGILALGRKLSTQPFTQDEQLIFSTLANQTAIAIENARLYNELRDAFVQSVTALANAIDIRDTYTNTHSQQIASWAAKTARLLGCTPGQVDEIYLGGLLHDIGKIGIPDEILRKPGKLTPEEWQIVHTHPHLGAALIAPIKRLARVSPLIEYSHERFDGKGYPHGVSGQEIPLGARILSVVDSYSAMLDKRPYKEPYDSERVLRELKQNAGKMYDPRVVEAFLKIIQAEEDARSAPGKEADSSGFIA